MKWILSLVLLFPLVGAALNGFLGTFWRRHAHRVALVGVGGAWVSAVVAVLSFRAAGGNPVHITYFTWLPVGSLQLPFAVYFDALTAVMVLTVTTVAFLIHVYSIGYMHGDPGYRRYFANLNLFVFAMLLLVMADSYLLLFVGWEGVGLCSYLLIGHEYHRKAAANAAIKAFVVNRIGDAGFLIGLFLLFSLVGSLRFPEVFARLHEHGATLHDALVPIGLLLFLGATGKSAQLPLFVWLPDAMEGPTPVSALIHAATMVTAGVYLIARSAPLYHWIPEVGLLIATVGALTALMAAYFALTQTDLKRILAYSTISQLGYMFLAVGLGAYTAGIFHLFTHAFFKALLFLGAGSVMHATHGELNIHRMGGYARKLPHTAWTFVIASLALAGIPPLAGFFSKDEILGAAYGLNHTTLWWIGTITALMTAYYMFRAVFRVFWGTPRDRELYDHLHESPPVMTVPLWILAAASVLVGFLGAGGEHGLFQRFLAPVLHGEHATGNLTVLMASILAGVLGILLAYQFFGLGRPDPAAWSRKLGILWHASYRKLWIDEIYDVLVRRVVKGIARGLYLVSDRVLVDGTVNLVGWIQLGMGSVLSRMQSGNVRTYLYWGVLMLAFAAWVLGTNGGM